MEPLVIAFGLAAGVLVGLTGIGGGSLMTPLLILVFGFKPIVAVGTDIAYGAVTKAVGAWRHLRHGTVDVALAAWLGAGSVPGAIIGVSILGVLESTVKQFDRVLFAMLAGALLITAIAVLARTLFLPAAGERDELALEYRQKCAAVASGAFVGLILGVTSAGSGSLIAVALIILFRLVPRRVVGTDVFHASILLWAAAIAHVVAGNVDFALAGTILLGSVPGVVVGTRLSVRIPVGALRIVLAVVLFAAAFGLLAKAEIHSAGAFVVAATVGLVLLAGTVAVLLRRHGSPALKTDPAPRVAASVESP